VRVIPVERRARVLTPARFGCLAGIPTLNITRGCSFRCTYCYARGYSHAPPEGEVHLYASLPDLLQGELSRRRSLPAWVILNTASDSFQNHPDILDVTFRVAECLLAAGIGISLITKGVVPARFLDLFGRTPEKVFCQIGLASLSEAYWRAYEPGTPSPEERLESLRRLAAAGIQPEVRVDPLIPFVTDLEPGIRALFERFAGLGIRAVALNYLHLRPAIRDQIIREIPALHRKLIDSCFHGRDWGAVGTSSATKLLPPSLRDRGYRRIRAIAETFGIEARVCRCKNPDLQAGLCSSGRIRALTEQGRPVQLSLFQC
jgi:DNA repair photolyase